ncbi:MAG TPA: hypothetical protein EYQ62_09225 [Verrucomicrobiales bacterium]|jgi:hypothetical protein|nr:hypothetical protein [Verrucomicrobiales bacterium]HIL24902.1 hypothetical protein [Verrucomicrobiota bacterium]
MQLLWLAKGNDDLIFIITLVVVLLVVIAYLVLGRDDTIQVMEEESEPMDIDDPRYHEKVVHRLDRTNDLLTSIRNSILIFIVIVVLVPVLWMLLIKGCDVPKTKSSGHVLFHPNTYNC